MFSVNVFWKHSDNSSFLKSYPEGGDGNATFGGLLPGRVQEISSAECLVVVRQASMA